MRTTLRAILAVLMLSLLDATAAFRCGAARPIAHTVAAHRVPVVAMAAPSPPSVSKQALVDAIAVKAGVSKKTAALVLSATLDVIVDSVCDGHKVSLIGFASFQSKERPEREMRNPKTGEKMIVAAATVPAFSFGKSFKDAVKEAGGSQS